MNPAPWYTSPVALTTATSFIAAVAVLAPKLAVKFGWVDPAAMAADAAALLTIIGVGVAAIGSLVAFIQRVRSKTQPLTFNKASATAQVTQTSQVMQNAHDAIAAGATITGVTIKPPPATPTGKVSL